MGRKSRAKKRRARMDGSGTAAVVGARGPSDPRKMSEVLFDIAEPLLRGIDPATDPDNFEAALVLGAALWNASVPDNPLATDAAKRKVLAELRKLSTAAEADDVERLCIEVMERARNLYPDEERIIADVEVAWDGAGRWQINVASARGLHK